MQPNEKRENKTRADAAEFIDRFLPGLLSDDLYTQTAWLPKLPVPPLEQTMAAYLEAVQVAVGDPEQVAETRRIVEQFMRPGGVGPKLQDQLMDKQSKEDNWVQIV